MFNPLLDDPSKLKDSELELKILDLSKKYHLAMRFGQGGVCQQILIILDSLKFEQQKRGAELLKKSATSQNKDLDSLINVS
jgi:hypothetical protein